jgi:ribosomal protein S18 acetylase RimI-like enzyme
MIRKFSPSTNESDFADLKAAYLELFNAPEALKYLSFTFKPFDDETVTNWFRSHLESGVAYYATLDPHDQIIGIGVTKASTPYGFELLGLVVRADHRGQGIGRGLVEHIVDVAQKEGFNAVDISVFADNKRMLRLVIDLDFIPVGITHRARADGTDVVHLKKYLNRKS